MIIDLQAALAAAGAAARRSAQELVTARACAIRHKTSPTDLVTEWDERSEAVIREVLGAPSVAPGQIWPVVGEELGGSAAPTYWLVDPIDGTVNFAHGLPLWCISIALVHEGTPVVGVVLAPALGWHFWATQGDGAWLQQLQLGTLTPLGVPSRLSVSATPRIAQALLVTGFPYDRATSPDNNFAQWIHLQRTAGACRRLGSAALDLCLVAQGVLDGYWERKIKAWDIAAGMLIVREAGGEVCDFAGHPPALDGAQLVAANPTLLPLLVEELARTP